MPDGTEIVFRIQPNDPQNPGSWSEKVMFDCLRQRKNWAMTIGVDTQMLPWHHNNIRQENVRGYPIRLFKIKVKKKPAVGQLVQLGEHICQHINAHPGNDTVIQIRRNDFIWLTDKPVWSDVIGFDAALAKLIKIAGQPMPGFYELNHKLIDCFFKPGTLSADLARILHAPLDQMHPSERHILRDNDDQGNYDEILELEDSEDDE